MKKIINNEKGIALVIVIMIISIIIAVTLELNMSSRYEIYESANLGDVVRSVYAAKSGFNMGEALLAADANGFDSLNEDWATLDSVSSESKALFNGEYFILHIDDESGKIPIKKISSSSEFRDLLLRFLKLPEFDLDEEQASDIVDAIKDWTDQDDELTGFGAEKAYYEGLEKPYMCKNGELDCIEELLMIKGISENLYYGKDGSPGISDYLTIHGEGRININTAPRLVLKALSDDVTDEMVSDMDDFRRDEENNLSDFSWYKTVQGMDGINISNSLITTGSSFFRITSTGYMNDVKRSVSGVVGRNADEKVMTILSWKLN